MLQFWRNLGPPMMDLPIAFCDSRTVRRDEAQPFVVSDYTSDRSRDGPERFLAGYRAGYLQSDAFAGYDRLHARGLIAVGCWAHARRKFYQAREHEPARMTAVLLKIGKQLVFTSCLQKTTRLRWGICAPSVAGTLSRCGGEGRIDAVG